MGCPRFLVAALFFAARCFCLLDLIFKFFEALKTSTFCFPLIRAHLIRRGSPYPSSSRGEERSGQPWWWLHGDGDACRRRTVVPATIATSSSSVLYDNSRQTVQISLLQDKSSSTAAGAAAAKI